MTKAERIKALGKFKWANSAKKRQQILEAMKLIGSEEMDTEAFHKAVLEVFELGPTQRQRTLARLLGRSPEDFIP